MPHVDEIMILPYDATNEPSFSFTGIIVTVPVTIMVRPCCACAASTTDDSNLAEALSRRHPILPCLPASFLLMHLWKRVFIYLHIIIDQQYQQRQAHGDLNDRKRTEAWAHDLRDELAIGHPPSYNVQPQHIILSRVMIKEGSGRLRHLRPSGRSLPEAAWGCRHRGVRRGGARHGHQYSSK
jgi:hypothetical protein